MKKVLIAILAVVALASCQQEDAPQGVKYPILFGSTDTRAVATVDSLKKGFMVYAYVDGNAGSTSFAKKVTHSVVEGSDIWALETPEYWLPDTDYYFKAFYPSELSAGTLVVTSTNKNQNFTIEGYDITEQEDVMVAEATASVGADASAPATGSVVDLEFKHLLANVTIKVKSQIDGVTINGITISNIADYGTYKEQKWSSSNKTSITVEPNVELSKGEEYVDVTNGGILVIPAEANGVTLSISTSSKNYDNIKIPAINWEIGNKYTYTIEIQQNDIILNNPNVAKWDSDSATGSVIIK